MKPILLKGHERSITKVIYNREGDILFSVSKDSKPTAWWSDNGERIGTYNGHQGAVWDIDVTHDSKLLLTGSADASTKVWNVELVIEVLHIKQQGPVRAVGWSEGHQHFFSVSNPLKKTATNSSLLQMFETPRELLENASPRTLLDPPMPIASYPIAETTCAVYMPMNRGVMLGCTDGMLRIYGQGRKEPLLEKQAHESLIFDIQFNKDKTLFITSSKDMHARMFNTKTMQCLKTFKSFVPVNSASIHPQFEHIMFGGGQDAMSVTTTDTRSGNFEVRFFHMIFQTEFGRVKGHFGPVNSLAFHPDGSGFVSGGEDGYVRVHKFTADYLTKHQKQDRKLEKAERMAKELEAKGLFNVSEARSQASKSNA